jgi:hypothetical protein
MPVLDIRRIYSRKEDQDAFLSAQKELGKLGVSDLMPLVQICEKLLKQEFIAEDAGHLPSWILDWANRYRREAFSIEKCREVGKKFKSPLSEEIIRQRKEL